MTRARPWIAYVGPFAFPDGGAAARRILGNAKALVCAGYEVVVVSGQPAEPGSSRADIAPGVHYVSVGERDSEHLPKVIRYARYALMGKRTRQWLNARPYLPTAVIIYSGYTPYLLQLTRWADRRNLPLLFDAVEWYSASSVGRFLISPYLWNSEIAMRLLIPRTSGVIAISRSLASYYERRDLPVRRVPPLFDPEEISQVNPVRDERKILRLAYCGSPGSKDLLGVVIDAVISLNKGQGRILLDVAGPSNEEIFRRYPYIVNYGAIPECLRVHGPVSHARSLEIVGSADFTVFLRQIDRVSTNGFPTKFVESFALGTPVIANLTSDLDEHLRDGKNGLVCAGPTSEDMVVTLGRAIALSERNKLAMRNEARSEAERAFSYRTYVSVLRDLVELTQHHTHVQKGRHEERSLEREECMTDGQDIDQ